VIIGLQSNLETIQSQIEEVKDGLEESATVERWFSEAVSLVVEPFLEQGRS
jgi:hypothetical protein